MSKCTEQQDISSPLLTVQEACTYLLVSKSKLYRLIEKGDFARKIRIGNSTRFLQSDLNNWLEGCKEVQS
ncbi:helix-turn-helix transcriptional regulator [Thalassotalea psychrophila]|uniref:helix-turn-helix transcriptional regulator n=1 Tax=Thalassotalea psychrophila TaxID=3065647 RepID=UPI00386B9BC2